jgi:RNA polymerase sigma-70 factor (ECF subfamily)
MSESTERANTQARVAVVPVERLGHRRLGHRPGRDLAHAAEARVVLLPIADSDRALVAALRAGRVNGKTALFDRYSNDVERVLYRILGTDPDVVDLMQDVFITALVSIGKLKDPDALRSWLIGIAVRKAKRCIARRRRRETVMRLFSSTEPQEREAVSSSPEVSEALRATYMVLSQMATDARIVFALRHVEGMELRAIAATCHVSLATVKRRLLVAQRSFYELAQGHSALAEWVGTGDPWS